jgi:fused signal recognition particle receptor
MNNDDKTTIRTAAIIGGVIGAILLGLMIKIDGTTKGTVIGVGCLLICGIVGIIIGSILENKKLKENTEEDEEQQVETTEEVNDVNEEPEKAEKIDTIQESEKKDEVLEENQKVEEAEVSEEVEEQPEEESEETETTKEVEEVAKKEEVTEQEEVNEKPEGGFFSRLVSGLTKTRNSINESFNNLFSGFSEIDDDFYDELEETLITADLGLDTTEKIIDELKDLVKKNHIKEVEECRELVINLIKSQMFVEDEAYDFEDKKTVMLIIGVNGVGKTTSIGKLAAQYKGRGKKVMMCAADTFRAAAIDQLKTWSNRAGVEIIAQDEGSDPAAVTFDAVKAAAARDVDILLVDTAGRLHNKKNLMDELAKMKRIIEKEYSDAHLETLIVLDGSTGQNALEQARQFSNVTQIDGIIITKLDGTAKGGIAIAIQSELNVPVKYIGVGEHIEDLQKFDPDSYVNALFADMDTRSDIEILMPEE